MDDKIEKTRQIKRAHEKAWLGIDGVVAVGIGMSANGEPCIVVSTKIAPAKLSRSIPSIIDGIIVEVRQSGELSAL